MGVLAVVAIIAVIVFGFTSFGEDEEPGPVVANPPAPAAPQRPSTGCQYPAQILDLTAWNLTVPDPYKENSKEVEQPDLAKFTDPQYFHPIATCDGVAFRAPVTGATTSNSSYPRSELREMTSDGSEGAAWSSSVGTHTLIVNEAFTVLPQGKPNLVGAQIHDGDDDVSVFRLEGSNLYVTKGDDTHHKLVTADYVLGTRFEAKYVVSRDQIQAFYNGQLQTTIARKFSDAYFKVGAYVQANCEDRSVPCNKSNVGETTVYSVQVEHR